MSTIRRRGFTLVEMLVSLVLLGVVSGGLLSVAFTAMRTAGRQRERAKQESALRDAAAVISRELGDIVPALDLAGFSAESVTYRAGRGSGRTCGSDGASVVLRDGSFRSWRLPDAARDSLLILLPADSSGGMHWVVQALLGPPVRARCTDGTPGLRIPIDPAIALRATGADLAVRVAEWMRFRAYLSGGEWWLGARSLRAGDVTQPIAGPFGAGGISLALLDGSGAPTGDPSVASAIEVRLTATSSVSGAGRTVSPDTLSATVRLANGASS